MSAIDKKIEKARRAMAEGFAFDKRLLEEQIETLLRRIQQLGTERDDLAAALEDYGDHKMLSCPAYNDAGLKCECGFAAALYRLHVTLMHEPDMGGTSKLPPSMQKAIDRASEPLKRHEEDK